MPRLFETMSGFEEDRRGRVSRSYSTTEHLLRARALNRCGEQFIAIVRRKALRNGDCRQWLDGGASPGAFRQPQAFRLCSQLETRTSQEAARLVRRPWQGSKNHRMPVRIYRLRPVQ